MTYTLRFCLLLLLAGVNTLAAFAQQRLVLATYQYADNNRIANIQPLADYIRQQTGTEVVTKSYPSVHQFIAGIQNNEVDIALINTFGYFLLDASGKPHAMKPVAVLHVKEGAKDNYTTAILGRKNLEADTLQDISAHAKHYRLMLVAPGSTSGNLVPRLALSGAGIADAEQAFNKVSYGQNHKGALDSLLNGQTDIAAFGSTEYFKLLQQPDKAQQVKLLWLSPEIPLGPVMMHARVDAQLQSSILQLLLGLHQSNAAALESVKAGWSEAKQADYYIRLAPDYYTPFKKQLGSQQAMEAILTRFAN